MKYYLNCRYYVVDKLMPNRVVNFVVTNHQTQNMHQLVKKDNYAELVTRC